MTAMKQAPLGKILIAASSGRWRFRQGMSINATLAQSVRHLDGSMRAPVQAILYESIRKNALIDAIINRLASREPSPEVRCLLEVSFTALLMGQYSDFTVADQAVAAAKSIPATAPASGFINALIRNFLRQKDALLDELMEDESVRFNAPQWWIDRVKAAAPERWESVLTLVNSHPPMTLRVNRRLTTPEAYLEELKAAGLDARQTGPEAITLTTPVNTQKLPGFNEGLVSVQDAGTQLAADLLPIQAGDRVLDACAAPGGKTCHLLERYDCDVTALEIDAKRAERISENLKRLKLEATLKVTDALALNKWWDRKPFDAILLDAPCTASGVVRRQPDTPWLRRESDVASLARQQRALMDGLWPVLKSGGHMLYATCSIFPEEGKVQVREFLSRHEDARIVGTAKVKQGMITLLPDEHDWQPEDDLPGVHDGFFYALLRKE